MKRFCLFMLSWITTWCSPDTPPSEKKVYFIVNPISGIGKQRDFEKNLKKTSYTYSVKYTERAGHASLLSKKAKEEGYDIVVAVGGDGTVNEVAEPLIGSETALGIIPTGSGNGFARHLKISTNLKKALKTIERMKMRRVDTMQINSDKYLSVAGIGFDADVSVAFSNQSRRGLASYLKVVLQELTKYQPKEYELVVDGKPIVTTAFLITFANAAQYGNNIFIAPHAKIDDGYIDLCILESFPKHAAPKLIQELLTKKIDRSKYVKTLRCKEVVLRGQKLQCHIDGDPKCYADEVRVNVLPSSLKVIR